MEHVHTILILFQWKLKFKGIVNKPVPLSSAGSELRKPEHHGHLKKKIARSEI